jgi:hypothetical protein
MGGLDPPIQLLPLHEKLDGRLKAGHGDKEKQKRRRLPGGVFVFKVVSLRTSRTRRTSC